MLEGGESLCLLRIALEIARDAYHELDIESYVEKVNELADRIRDRCAGPSRPRKVLGQINWAMFVEEGYQGNRENYFDPRNSYLNEVIDRKTGIPISLSVLYLALAHQLDLPIAGVNLPAHFMLRLLGSSPLLFVDPFHSGELLDQPGCERRLTELARQPIQLSELQLAPCPARMVVARMLRNLKAIYLGTNDFLSALSVQRRLATVAEDQPEELRDLGMICLQVDRPGEAIDPLEAYLNAQPKADDADSVTDLLNTAQRIVARWN
jgi:regulator of sirC expression with transglutaminase-like and TPR domain